MCIVQFKGGNLTPKRSRIYVIFFSARTASSYVGNMLALMKAALSSGRRVNVGRFMFCVVNIKYMCSRGCNLGVVCDYPSQVLMNGCDGFWGHEPSLEP